MKLSHLLVLVLPLLLTACGLSAQQQADYSSVQRSGVSPAIYDKMMHGDALSVSDVESLSRAKVSDAVTLRYMRDEATIYVLSSADVQELSKAGVSQSIVDYMLQTPRMYQQPVYPEVGIGIGYGWYEPYPYYPRPYHRWH